jgi:nucleotide-binding universal stress UspA family protein
MNGIVVGVDGSEGSTHALTWAATEARLRGALLTVVHAWHPPYVGGGYPLVPAIYDLELYEKSAQQVLDEAVDAVDPSGLTGGVAGQLVEGGAASALLAATQDADLVVVGARGVGGFLGLLIGSVSTQVTHHASCPVVVVPVRATRSA